MSFLQTSAKTTANWSIFHVFTLADYPDTIILIYVSLPAIPEPELLQALLYCYVVITNSGSFQEVDEII